MTVRGSMSWKVLCSTPAESRTVRWIRYQTLAAVSPVRGMVNVPLFLPLIDWG